MAGRKEIDWDGVVSGIATIRRAETQLHLQRWVAGLLFFRLFVPLSGGGGGAQGPIKILTISANQQ